MSIEYGSPRWKELVQTGIIKTADRNWFLGDAALEIAPMGADRAHNGSADLLAKYADEIDLDPGTLRVYRQVAAAWPHENRVSRTSWKVHQMLMGRKDLIRPGMTVTQAHEALGQKNTGRTGPRASVEDRVAAVRELMTDPQVVEQVAEHVAKSPEIRRAVRRADEEMVEKVKSGEERYEAERRQRRRSEAAEHISAQMGRACTYLNEILINYDGVEFTEDEQKWLELGVDRLNATVELVKMRIVGKSDVDWDAEIQKLTS